MYSTFVGKTESSGMPTAVLDHRMGMGSGVASRRISDRPMSSRRCADHRSSVPKTQLGARRADDSTVCAGTLPTPKVGLSMYFGPCELLPGCDFEHSLETNTCDVNMGRTLGQVWAPTGRGVAWARIAIDLVSRRTFSLPSRVRLPKEKAGCVAMRDNGCLPKQVPTTGYGTGSKTERFGLGAGSHSVPA